MNKNIFVFLFVIFSAAAAFAQDTAAVKNNAGAEITAERIKNPNTIADPHPEGVITGERTRNPHAPKKPVRPKRTQPVTNEKRSGSPQD